MLRYRLIMSTAAEWFGRPLVRVSDADMWRFVIAQDTARAIEKALFRNQHGQ